MNTFLGPAQEALKEQYRAFAREVVAPSARALEAHGEPLGDILKKMGQAGHLGISVPQEYGGQGLPFLNTVLFVESVCQWEPGLGLTLASHFAVAELIMKYGTDEHKSRYLPLLSKGECVGTLSISEENAGTDFEAVESTAVDEGESLVVQGRKTWVVNGQIAGLFVALFRAGGELTLSLIDASPSESLKIGTNRARLGLRSAFANDVEFASLRVPKANVLPSREGAAEQVLFAMDVAKVVLAGAAVGLTESALNTAADHAKSRRQFGKNIGQFQGIQWKIADHTVEMTGSRLLTYRAAWSKDESPEEFRLHAAMCKWFAARAARVYSGEAIQVLGSFGLDAESPLERLYRDAKALEIVGGTSEFQKVLLVKELGI